jgi:methylmalonyl-CoA/ethylmalonyl-CoA epimerase
MIGRLNHIAIVVPDLAQAARCYRDILGAEVSRAEDIPEHGVTVVFVKIDNTKIELLHPLGEHSAIKSFLEKHPDGGLHHTCYEVQDLISACDHLVSSGARILGDGKPKIGAHGKPVIFLHPKDFMGTLIELEQV